MQWKPCFDYGRRCTNASIFYTPRPICIKFDIGDVHNNTLSEFYFYENRHNEVVLFVKVKNMNVTQEK